MKKSVLIPLVFPILVSAQGTAPAVTARVSAILSNGVAGGTQGLYLKHVEGPVIAAQQEKFVFDPGTSSAVVPLLLAIFKTQNYSLALDSQIVHYDNPATGCPNPALPNRTESLDIALHEMMWHSDNARTHEVQVTLDRVTVDAYARAIGMTNTRMPPIPGCVTATSGQMTLADAGKLHEAVASGAQIPLAKDTFHGFLAGKAQFAAEGSDWNHLWDTDIPVMLRQEAPAGTLPSQLSSYQSLMDVGYKAGSTVICQNSDCGSVLENLSLNGWARIPFCNRSQALVREYSFGIFVANAPDTSYAPGKKTAAQSAFNAARAELLREQVREGLASCYGGNAVMLTPSPGSTLTGRTVTFTWSPGQNWDGYRLDLGRSAGGAEFASLATTATTVTLTNLPCDGKPLSARLWMHGAGGYVNPADYPYTACTISGPQITSPVPGSTLRSASVTFVWTAVAGADLYRLEVGSAAGANDIGIAQVAETTATINNIPTDGRGIFVRITAHNPSGAQVSNDYAYNNVAPGQTPIISSVLNAASLQPSLSPISLAILTGSNFGASPTVTVGATRAVIVGTPTSNQITFLIPASAPVGSTTVTIASGSVTSAAFPITLSQVSPGLYDRFVDGAGVPITVAHPARPDTVAGVFAVGLGPADSSGKPLNAYRVLLGPNKVSATLISAAAVPDSPGVTQVNFRVPSGVGGGPQPIVIAIGTFSSNAAQIVIGGPAVSAVVNAASFANGAKVAPGSIVSLFGSDLGDADGFGIFPTRSLPGGGVVTFNGISAPLFDAVPSGGQINLLVPFELPTDGNVAVVVTNNSGVSTPFSMPMAPAAPGLFRLTDPSNDKRANGAVLLANTAWRVMPASMAAALGIPQECKGRVAPAALCGQPAAPGDVIQIYVTGLGRATPNGNPSGSSLRTGDVAPANGSILYRTVETPLVNIGGYDAQVVFSGIAPGFAGLYQVNVVVPDAVDTGDDVPVTITVGGASDTATIAVRIP